MIALTCNFFSKTLLNHVDVDILLPSLPDNDCVNTPLEDIYKEEARYPVLYLLHGALDDRTMWLRHTGIESYAEKAHMAVVMPSGGNWFYTDAKLGPKYFTFITEELPLFAEKNFPVSRCREERFIAGPSMGGYGATKCALRCPDKYAAFGDLSGAVDPERLYPKMVAMGFDIFRYDLIFGNDSARPEAREDVYCLAQGLADRPEKPDAYVYCGLEDTANYEMNRRLAQTLEAAGFRTSFRDGTGVHDWKYWDTCICHFLQSVSSGLR